MRDHDHDRAEDEEREHFIECHVCGKFIDSRDMAEVLAHASVEHEAEQPGSIVAKTPGPLKI